MKEDRIDLAALSMGLLFSAWAAVLLVCLALAACDGGQAAAGPTGPEKAVTGDWAAEIPDAAGLVRMSLAPSGAYQVTIEPGGTVAERERGAWLLRSSRVVFSPATCEAADQAGAPLHLIACSGPDSIPAAAAGDRWPVSFTAGGEVLQLDFHRL